MGYFISNDLASRACSIRRVVYEWHDDILQEFKKYAQDLSKLELLIDYLDHRDLSMFNDGDMHCIFYALKFVVEKNHATATALNTTLDKVENSLKSNEQDINKLLALILYETVKYNPHCLREIEEAFEPGVSNLILEMLLQKNTLDVSAF